MALNQSHVQNTAKENFCPESEGLGCCVWSEFALFMANLPECKYGEMAGAVEQQTALKSRLSVGNFKHTMALFLLDVILQPGFFLLH